MWPGCGLLTDVPTSGVGHRLLHFPIHRKNAISFLSAADSLLALFSLERFNSLLSYSWHQPRDLMAPFSVWVHSLPPWQNGQSQRNSTVLDTKTQPCDCDKWEWCLSCRLSARSVVFRDLYISFLQPPFCPSPPHRDAKLGPIFGLIICW